MSITRVYASLFLVGAVVLSGCNTSRIAERAMADMVGNLVASIEEQPDPKLVEDGLPTLLLFMDGMLRQSPDNRELLRAASTAYATYSQAFVDAEDDPERAVALFAKAKTYGMRLLTCEPTFAKAVGAPMDEFERAVKAFGRDDVPDMYAAGSAWLGWIVSQPESMTALAELPKALALMTRVLELDEDYSNGAVHVVFGIYYATQPPGAGQDMKKSKAHFERAIGLGGNDYLLPLVAYAEFYATAAFDEILFVETLDRVTAREIGEGSPNRLANVVAQRRARHLLENKDEIF